VARGRAARLDETGGADGYAASRWPRAGVLLYTDGTCDCRLDTRGPPRLQNRWAYQALTRQLKEWKSEARSRHGDGGCAQTGEMLARWPSAPTYKPEPFSGTFSTRPVPGVVGLGRISMKPGLNVQAVNLAIALQEKKASSPATRIKRISGSLHDRRGGPSLNHDRRGQMASIDFPTILQVSANVGHGCRPIAAKVKTQHFLAKMAGENRGIGTPVPGPTESTRWPWPGAKGSKGGKTVHQSQAD